MSFLVFFWVRNRPSDNLAVHSTFDQLMEEGNNSGIESNYCIQYKIVATLYIYSDHLTVPNAHDKQREKWQRGGLNKHI